MISLHWADELKSRNLSDPPNDIVALVGSGGARPVFVYYVNAHTLFLWLRYPEFRRLFDDADCRFYSDGWGAVLFFRLMGWPLDERRTAIDFLDSLCQNLQAHDYAVYFLGGRAPVLKAFLSRIAAAHPGLHVAGAHDGYFSSDEDVISDIGRSQADVLVIGMGSGGIFGLPRQEAWSHQHRSSLNVKLVWCVGGLYDVYPREKKREGKWYFEWLSRVRREPMRMIPRYLVDGLCLMAWFGYAVLAGRLLRRPDARQAK